MAKRSDIKSGPRLQKALREKGEASAERAAIVHEAWVAREDSGSPRHLGDLKVYEMELEETGDAVLLNVWTEPRSTASEPQYQILNPPLLASDPNGDVQLTGRSETFVEDPIRAVMQGIMHISSNGKESG